MKPAAFWWGMSESTTSVDAAVAGVREGSLVLTKKVDIRLPGKGNSDSHGARPVH